MSRVRILQCSPVFLLLLGCGSSSHSTNSGNAMTPARAGALAASVMSAESTGMANGSALPRWAPATGPAASGAPSLVMPIEVPSCATVATTGPDANGFTHQTWTFANCTDGEETLNGSVTIDFKAGDYQITFNHLVKSEDGGAETTTLDGTKHVVLDAATMTGTITVAHFLISHTEQDEPSENRSFLYDASWHTDWSVAGQYKLWGTFSATFNSDPTVTGSVDQAQALTWTAGCCRPTSGTLHLMQGTSSADVVFSLPCGTITITVAGQPSMTRHIGSCS